MTCFSILIFVKLSTVLLLLLLCITPGLVTAGTITGNLPVMTQMVANCTLTLSSSSIAFPDEDPTTMPVITAVPGLLSYTTKCTGSAGLAVTLTVLANGHLQSGSNIININNLSFQKASGGTCPGTTSGGTLSTTVAQSVLATTGNINCTDKLVFNLVNSYSYAVGNYSAVLTFTLTAQ